MLNDIPAPWKGFLKKLDTLLEEPIRLDCIGGFAAVMGYGLPRATRRAESCTRMQMGMDVRDSKIR